MNVANSKVRPVKRKGQSQLNTKWLNNAMKGIGASGKNVLTKLAPNLTSTVSEATKTSKAVVNMARDYKATQQRIATSVNQNKYVKYMNTAYKNAAEDLRAGRLQNKEREDEALERSLFGDSGFDDGFSFGDDDSDGGNTYQYIDNSGSSAALADISSSIDRQTDATLKTTKASVDAVISVASSAMYQMQSIGNIMNSHLENIENSLVTANEFQSENMSKFIEASMSFYERMGSRMDDDYSYNQGRIRGSSVIKNENGGIDIAQYKDYVKQNMKEAFKGSAPGQVSSMLSDSMIEAIIANPVGGLTDAVVGYLVPSTIKNSIASVENAFSSYMPAFLAKLSKWGENEGNSMLAKFKRLVGKTLGIEDRRGPGITKADAEINRGAIPFDGETKMAITHLIPKYLREQSEYLRAISEKMKANTSGRADRKDIWNWQTNEFTSENEINKDLMDQIIGSITNAISTDKFGEAIGNLSKSMTDEGKQKKMDAIIQQMYIGMEKSKGNINFGDDNDDGYKELINSIHGEAAMVNELKDYIAKLSQQRPDITTYGGTVSRLSARRAKEEAEKSITTNWADNNFLNSTVFQDEYSTDAEIARRTQGNRRAYGDISRRRRRSAHYGTDSEGKTIADRGLEFNGMMQDEGHQMNAFERRRANRGNGPGMIESMVQDGSNGIQNMFMSFARGNVNGGFTAIGDTILAQGKKLFDGFKANFFDPLKDTMFGTKDGDGYSRDGLFSGASNAMKDMVNGLGYKFTGKGYKDSKGRDHEDSNDTVIGKLKGIGSSVKEGIMTKLFGEQETDEHGNPTGNRVKKGGMFAGVAKTFQSGFDGWSKALFGSTTEDGQEKDHKQLMEDLKKNISDALPTAGAGAVVGAGFGSMAGGVLGNLIGGPLGGALIGSTASLLARSEKFQKYLFGEEQTDENGNVTRAGGVISKKTQDFFGKNKNFLMGSAALGTVKGTLFGGGLLGTLVGGPIGGALMGTATGIVLKSEKFQKFLYGDEENGTKGIVNSAKEMFSAFRTRTSDGKEKSGVGGSLVGGIGGAAIGGLIAKAGFLPAALSAAGPIGGAVMGLAVGIHSQKDNFKEYLFGKTTKDENGNVIDRKEGLVGKFTNMMRVNVMEPFANEAKHLVADAGITLKHDILAPIAFSIEYMTKPVKNMVDKMVGKMKNAGNIVRDTITDHLIEPIKNAVIRPIMKIGTGITKMIYGSIKTVVSAPFKFINHQLKKMTNPLHKFLKGVKHKVFSGIGFTFKWLRKTISNTFLGKGVKSLFKLGMGIVKSPFKLMAGVGGVANYLGDKMLGLDNGNDELEHTTGDMSFRDRLKLNERNKKIALRNEKRRYKHDRAMNDNEKWIAEMTDNQRTEDTEENRAFADEMARMKGKRERKKWKVNAKESSQHTVSEMSDQQLADADPRHLDATGRLTQIAQRILNRISHRDSHGNPLDSNGNSRVHTSGEGSRDDADDSSDTSNLTGADRVQQEIEAAGGLRNYASNKMHGMMSKLKSKLGYATGTSQMRSGISVVGEHGPELISFSGRGNAKVFSNREAINVNLSDVAMPALTKFASKLKGVVGGNASDGTSIFNSLDGAQDATIRKLNDLRDNNHKDAVDKAKTAEELKKERAEEKADKRADKQLQVAEEHKEATVNFGHGWLNIFGKKGLLTAAAITAGTFLISKLKNINLPAVMETVTSVVSGIGTVLNNTVVPLIKTVASGIASLLGKSLEDIMWTEENDARTDGKSAGEIIEDQATKVSDSVSDLKKGKLLSAAGNLIYNKDGTTNAQSDANAKAILNAPNVIKTTGKFLGKHTKIGRLATKIVNSKAGTAGKNVVKAGATSLVNASKSGVSKLATKGAEKAGTKLAQLALKETEVGGGSKLLTKTLEALEKFLSKIATTLSKDGAKVSTNIFKSSINTIKTVVTKNFPKISGKISAILASDAGAAAMAGIGWVVKNGLFVTLGAINGVSGTARLFQVDKDYVNAKMTLISTAIGAFEGTAVGSIVDVVNQLVAQVTGSDFVSNIAILAYKAISNDEADAKLDEGQGQFKEKYLEYKNQAIEDSYNKVLEDGTIDSSVSLEDYKKGCEDGTYQAQYMSFIDYNADQHKTLGTKILDGVSKVGSGIKKAGSAVVKGVKSAWGGAKDLAGKAASGIAGGVKSLWSGAKSLGSKALGAIGVTAKTAGSAVVKKGLEIASASHKFLLGSTTKAWYETDTNAYYTANSDGTYDKFSANGDKIAEGVDASEVESNIAAGKLVEGTIKQPSGLSKMVATNATNLVNGLKGFANKSAESIAATLSDGASIATNIKENGLFPTLKTLAKGKVTKDGWFDPNGNYYVANGKNFDYYSANGDLIQEKVDGDEVMEKIESGLLIKDNVEVDTAGKKALTKIKSAVSDAWDKAKDTVSSGWKSFTSWITGGSGGKSGYGSRYDEAIGEAKGGSGFRFRGLGGGKGDGSSPDTVNGFPYYSQEDSKWAGRSYTSNDSGNDGATMADTGCGPTAMAMVTSKLTGKNVDPTQMASLAAKSGDRDSTGTNWNFINKASAATELSSAQAYAPSAQYISSQLDSGKPMILSGQSNDSSSAYTSAGHYVVAVGKDANGNAIINDPRGKQYSGKKNINQLASETGSAWAFGNGASGKRFASGRKLLNKIRGGGRGNAVNADAVIQVAKNEVGYIEKASNANLDNPSGNPGNANYTKYGDYMGLNGQYWCASFVCWCFWTAANHDKSKVDDMFCGKQSGSCTTLMDQFKAAGRFDSNPQPGDCIFFSGSRHAGANHIGIVVSSDGSKVYTVEGNTSGGSAVVDNGGCVAEKSYDLSNGRILGYGHPKYDGSSDYSGSTSSDGSATTSASASSTDIFSMFGTALSELGTRAFQGALTGNFNTDWSTLLGSTDSSTTTSSSSTSGASNYSGNSNAEKIWNFLRSKGFSKEATAGIMGNLQQESSLDPNAKQKNGLGRGLAQWSEGERWNSVLAKAQSMGKSEWDIEPQLEVLYDELNGGDSATVSILNKSYGGLDGLKTMTDIQRAADAFEQSFERAGKPVMQNRYSYAQSIYDTYKDAGGGSGKGLRSTTARTNLRGGRGKLSRAAKALINGGSGNSYHSSKQMGGRGTSTTAKSSLGSSSSVDVSSIVKQYGVKSTETNSTQILGAVVELLGAIANNTGTTSTKLDYLQNLSSGSNIVVAGNGNSSNTLTSSASTQKASRNQTLATQIAKG